MCLTVAEGADGGAVLAAGRVVDLLGSPPRLWGKLLLGACGRHGGIGGLALRPAHDRGEDRDDEKLEDMDRERRPRTTRGW